MPKKPRRLTVHTLTVREVRFAQVTRGIRRIAIADEQLNEFTSICRKKFGDI